MKIDIQITSVSPLENYGQTSASQHEYNIGEGKVKRKKQNLSTALQHPNNRRWLEMQIGALFARLSKS